MRIWLPLAIIITLFCGLIYVVAQQIVRIGANEPQVAIVGDIVTALQAGIDPKSIPSNQALDISTSLSPYVMIFDDSGTPIASSAQLNGATPVPPKGIFDYARAQGEDRVTWQPAPGVRSAAIIRHYAGTESSGFVLVGRSLKEAERETQSLMFLVLLGWAAMLIISFLSVFFLQKYEAHILKLFP